LSWQNRWSENGFLVQICCLTIGPAFMAAGVYLCLRRIVSAFGPENSRLPPEYYTRIVSPFLLGVGDMSAGSRLICFSLVHPM
jgi:hypothetical protein